MGEERFQYNPETNYEIVDERNSDKVIPLLEPFKKGVMKALEPHLLNADGLAKYFTSGQVSPEFRAETRNKTKQIDDRLMAIVRGYSELESDLQPRQLEILSHRDYFNYFTDHEMEGSKVEYVKLLKSYEYIKAFNNLVKDNWHWLRNVYESISVTAQNRTILEQILAFKIYPRIELTELTDLYLRRLRLILKVNQEEERADKVYIRGSYSSLINYTMAAVFLEDIEGIIGDTNEPVHREADVQTEHQQPQKDSCIKNPFMLDSRGIEDFNQGYLYTMEIDQERVQLDQKKIKRAVYIETHLGAEEAALRQDLIRKFISQAGSKDRISEYVGFLNQYCNFAKDTLLLHLHDLDEKEGLVFLYHFGPIYFLKTMMHFMREGRTGFIHRRMKKDQMLRELPLEYVKYTLKDWWDENVYLETSRHDRNSRELYKKIMASITDIWRKEQPKTFQKIKTEPHLVRALRFHDIRTLGKFVETEVSFLLYVILLRFLGPDFIYLPVHRKKRSSESSL